jgi:hypothetical protein
MLGQLKTFQFLDRLGITVSTLCALHCALTPIISMFLPLLSLSFLENELTEYIFVALSISIGITSLFISYFRLHKQLKPLIFFFLGAVLILIVKLFFEENLTLEIPVMILGGSIIAIAHFINRKLCQSCLSCQNKDLL